MWGLAGHFKVDPEMGRIWLDVLSKTMGQLLYLSCGRMPAWISCPTTPCQRGEFGFSFGII